MLSALAAKREAVASGDELLVGATEIGERPVTRGPCMLTAVQQQWIGRAGRFWASSRPAVSLPSVRTTALPTADAFWWAGRRLAPAFNRASFSRRRAGVLGRMNSQTPQILIGRTLPNSSRNTAYGAQRLPLTGFTSNTV